MKKIYNKVNAMTVTKMAPLGAIALATVNYVHCADIFEASKSVLNKVSSGLFGLLSLVAVIMVVWNIIMLFVQSGDEKKVAIHKEAIKKIMLFYAVGILAGFILTTIASTISSAIGGNSVINSGTIKSDGTLQ